MYENKRRYLIYLKIDNNETILIKSIRHCSACPHAAFISLFTGSAATTSSAGRTTTSGL
jgi:hypothetical protein